MQNDQNYSHILNLVVTKEDLDLVNSELDLLEKGLFELKDLSFDVVLGSKVRKATADLITKLLTIEPDKKKLLTSLRKELTKIKFAELTLPYDPNLKEVEDIYELINADIPDQKIALDIKMDPSIIGGALISYEGKFFDGSISHSLEEVLKNYV